MEGPRDIDSLEFQMRLRILQISELTGESRSQVLSRAIEECYRRTKAAATDEKLASRDSMVTVQLAPDVAEHFPDSTAANEGLRELLRLRRVR